jgi:hypothetical protein
VRRVHGWCTAVLFGVAWFLPVLNDTTYEPTPAWLPGWDAFTIALGLRDGSDPSVLSACSALTNLLMPLAIFWLVRAPARTVPRHAGGLVAAAAVLNLAWVWPPSVGLTELGVGYWCWVGSFVVASGMLVMHARHARLAHVA